MNKRLMLGLAMLLVASVAFAQRGNFQAQGATVLNGGILSTPGGFAGSGPNNQGGPGLGRHDLKDNVNGKILGCESCHLPHTAPIYGKSFLWAWKTVPTNIPTYVTGTNPSGALVTPNGTTGNSRSVLCLTCHDGTSASANGVVAAVTFNGTPYALVNTSGGASLGLQSQHPVDAVFPITRDYVQPVAAAGMFGARGTVGIDSLPVWDCALRVECGTCHDAHKDYTANNGANGGIPFLRVANTNGTYLCRECHAAQ
ncbi:MAG: hypothetical protein ACLP9L_03165 [Thermoguttaceae bacterium]